MRSANQLSPPPKRRPPPLPATDERPTHERRDRALRKMGVLRGDGTRRQLLVNTADDAEPPLWTPILQVVGNWISADKHLCWARALYGRGCEKASRDDLLNVARDVVIAMEAFARRAGNELGNLERFALLSNFSRADAEQFRESHLRREIASVRVHHSGVLAFIL